MLTKHRLVIPIRARKMSCQNAAQRIAQDDLDTLQIRVQRLPEARIVLVQPDRTAKITISRDQIGSQPLITQKLAKYVRTQARRERELFPYREAPD